MKLYKPSTENDKEVLNLFASSTEHIERFLVEGGRLSVPKQFEAATNGAPSKLEAVNKNIPLEAAQPPAQLPETAASSAGEASGSVGSGNPQAPKTGTGAG